MNTIILFHQLSQFLFSGKKVTFVRIFFGKAMLCIQKGIFNRNMISIIVHKSRFINSQTNRSINAGLCCIGLRIKALS